MLLDPRNTLGLLGVDCTTALPALVRCPLCGQDAALEVRTLQHAHCVSCYFFGDAVELLAATKSAEVEDVVNTLVSSGLLHLSPTARHGYLTAVKRRVNCRALIARGMDYASVQHGNGAISAVLHDLDAPLRPSDLPAFGPHAFPLHVSWLKELGFLDHVPPELAPLVKETLQAWRTSMSLAVPAWCGVSLHGFWIFTRGKAHYLPLSCEPRMSVGFGLSTRISDRYAVVVDDPLVALRCAMWSIIDQQRLRPFFITQGVLGDVASYACQRTIYWSPSAQVFHYCRALSSAENRAVDPADVVWPAQGLPYEGAYGVFERHLLSAPQAAATVGKLLLSIPEHDARAQVQGLELTATSRESILSHVTGDSHEFLERVLGSEKTTATAQFGDRVVSDTAQGWMVAGKLISSARFYFDRVWVGADGDATASGEIIYSRAGNRTVIPFKDQSLGEASSIRKSPAKWLERLVLAHTGSVPFIHRLWASHLVEISQQLRPPVVTFERDDYGWRDNTLHLSRFAVDRGGVMPVTSSVSGPAIPYPEALDATEWGAFHDVSFATLVLHILVGALRAKDGLSPTGLLLVNAPHVLDRLSAVFGTHVERDPPATLLDRHATKPLPLLTLWSAQALPRLFDTPGVGRNVVASVDAMSARVSRVLRGWAVLRLGEQWDYGALRSIFHLLPPLLVETPSMHSPTLCADIAKILTNTCPLLPARNVLLDAGLAIDRERLYCANVASGGRLVELLIYAWQELGLPAIETPNSVSVRVFDFLRVISTQPVQLPSPAEMTEALLAARYLVKPSYNVWKISRAAWDLHVSLTRSLVVLP